MNKKGLTWNTIVTAIIALVVLVVLIVIFREQVDQIADKFLSIVKDTGTSTQGLSEDIKNLIPEE